MKTVDMTQEGATRILTLTKEANGFVDSLVGGFKGLSDKLPSMDQVAGGVKAAWDYLPNKADELAAKGMFLGGTKASALDGASEIFKDSGTIQNAAERVIGLFDAAGGPEAAMPRILEDLKNRGAALTPTDVKYAFHDMSQGLAPKSKEFQHYIHDLVKKTGLASGGQMMGSQGRRSLVNNASRVLQGGLLLGGAHAALKGHLKNRRDEDLERLRKEYQAKSASGENQYLYIPGALRAAGESISGAFGQAKDLASSAADSLSGIMEAGKDQVLGQGIKSVVNDGPKASSVSPLAWALLAGTGALGAYGGSKAIKSFMDNRREDKYEKYEDEAKQRLFQALQAKTASAVEPVDKSASSPMVNALVALSLLTGGAGFFGGRELGKKIRGQRERDFDKALKRIRPKKALEFLPTSSANTPEVGSESGVRLLPMPDPGAELAAPDRKRLEMPKLAGATQVLIEELVTGEMVKQAASEGVFSDFTGGIRRAAERLGTDGWGAIPKAINERGFYGKESLRPVNILKDNPKVANWALNKSLNDSDSMVGGFMLNQARQLHPKWFDGGMKEKFIRTAYNFSKKHPGVAKALLTGAGTLVGGVQSILKFLGKHSTMAQGASKKFNNFDRRFDENAAAIRKLLGSANRPVKQLQAPPVSRLAPVQSGGIAAA